MGRFRKKKDKEIEHGHREPIIVRIFKDNEPDKRTNVQHIDTEEASDNSDKTDEGSSRHKFQANQKYFVICVYALGFVAIAALLVAAVLHLSDLRDFAVGFLKVCTPFIAASLVAFIMTPIVNSVDSGLFDHLLKIKKPRLRIALSVILSYIVVFGLITLGLVKLCPQIGASIKDLIDKSGTIYESIVSYLQAFDEKDFLGIDLSLISDKVSNVLPEIISKLTSIAADIIPKLLSASVNLVKTAINVLLTIAISIYMVCDKRRIARATTQLIYAFMPYKKADSFITTAKECFQIFGGFIIGKSIDSLIIGILCFVVTSLLGLPYPVLVSVVVGITNMIPFFGPFIGAVPGILLYLCLDPIYALIFAITILALQQFDGWVLGPMILGDSTGLRPIWVIFAITVGGAYFGVLGMFLGVPLTAVIVFLANKAISSRLKKKNVEVS